MGATVRIECKGDCALGSEGTFLGSYNIQFRRDNCAAEQRIPGNGQIVASNFQEIGKLSIALPQRNRIVTSNTSEQ